MTVLVLAHQGGWDEILIPVVVVGAFVWAAKRKRTRERRGDRPTPTPPASPQDGTRVCGYCGEPVPGDASRCPACGFRS